MHGTNGRSTARLYFLDWLRILAFAALVVYHVGMYYVSWNFHVKSPFKDLGLEPWMKLTEPWRMSLIFLVSGAAAAFMLKAGPSLPLARRRTAYLLLPLLFGMLFIVPPQSYFEVVQKNGYSGNYLDFMQLYLTGYNGFCSNGKCLTLPTWNHLWFLPYLWIYTMVLLGTLSIWPRALQTAARLLDAAGSSFWLMFLPIAWLLLARLILFEPFPTTYTVWGDWFSHAVYLSMFAAGVVLAVAETGWKRLAALRWPSLLLAFAFWAILVWLKPARPFSHAVAAIFQWSAVVAAVGFAQVHLNVDHPLRVRLTEAVFPIYLVHQTFIIVGSQWLLPLRLAPAVEAPLLIAGTFFLSYATYKLVRRLAPLRSWFGLKSEASARRVLAT